MVQSCSAYGCKNRYHKDKDISFHKFPLARPDLCGKWVAAMKRRNFKPTKYSNICSQHFTKDCFKRECNNRVLKESAVPSVFHINKLQIKAQCPEQAIAPELSFSLPPASTHPPEPGVLQTPRPRPSSPTSSSSDTSPSSLPKEEDPLRASAFVSGDHNYTADDVVQQKKRVEQLVEQLNKLRKKLKTLRQKCRRQERQLERFRAMQEISKSGNEPGLGQSYVILPRELVSKAHGVHAAEGV